MNCYSPILMPNPRYLQLNKRLSRHYGKYGKCFSDRDFDDVYDEVNMTSPYLYAPCRRCPACMRRRSQEWRGRLCREYEYQKSLRNKTLFVTLTYDNISIKGASLRYKSDIARFFDRLRSKFRFSIRHFCVAELGDNTGRFHVHCLLFGAPGVLRPHRYLKRTKTGILHGSNDILVERWQHGIVDCSWLKDVRGAAYVAKYVSKFKPSDEVKHFFSPIIVSNKLGLLDIDSLEIERMRNAVKNWTIPYFEVAGRRYSYPYSVIRKYLSFADKMALARISGLKNSQLGGHFVLHDMRFNSFDDYKLAVSVWTKDISYFGQIYDDYADILFVQSQGDFDIKDYELPDYVPF